MPYIIYENDTDVHVIFPHRNYTVISYNDIASQAKNNLTLDILLIIILISILYYLIKD